MAREWCPDCECWVDDDNDKVSFVTIADLIEHTYLQETE